VQLIESNTAQNFRSRAWRALLDTNTAALASLVHIFWDSYLRYVYWRAGVCFFVVRQMPPGIEGESK
jgi:hypothetical protein